MDLRNRAARPGLGWATSMTALLLDRAQHEANRRRQPVPVGALAFELPPAATRQVVELGVAPGLARLPLGLQPPARLEAMERRVQRALLNLQHVLRHLLQALGDGVAVQRPERDDLQNQKIERALEKIGFRWRHDDT